MGNHCAPLSYDDKWIIAQWEAFKNWKKLCNEYNKVHGTAICYSTFKSHCNRVLDLNVQYTKEQIEWLKANYPRLGQAETTRQFNIKFQENKSRGAIKKKCNYELGLHVTEERLKRRATENTGRFHEVGTIRPGANKELYIKMKDGWKPLKYMNHEKIMGKNLVYLDGNKNNVSDDNLMYITREVSARMIKNKFWSEDPEITRTGIICCELEQALKDGK